MKIIIDEIDHMYYADVIISEEELELLEKHRIVEGKVTVKRHVCYVGLRLEGEFDMSEFNDS